MIHVFRWSVFSDAKQLDFNGHYLHDGRTALLIDPPVLSDGDVARLEEIGRPTRIILTNKDHQRDAVAMKLRFDAPIWIHEADRQLVECDVDETFTHGDILDFLTVVHIRDGKSPGESALYWKDERLLVLGDALIGRTPGELTLLPDEKFADVERARAGLRVLLDLDVEQVLVGDGTSIKQDAHAVLARAIAG